MVLYSLADSLQSHRIRYVLSEKGTAVDIVAYERHQPPEDLLELNPYGVEPTLVDRDLVLYSAEVIAEYLDERYPHPPLMPVDPVSRARVRLTAYRIQQDWNPLISYLEQGSEAEKMTARKALAEQLTTMSEVFRTLPYFLSSEMTLVDCALVPLLWRLQHFNIQLPAAAAPLMAYAERMFDTEGFKESLTDEEKRLRKK